MQILFLGYRDTDTLLRIQGYRYSSQDTGVQILFLGYRGTGTLLRIQGYRDSS